MKKVCVPKIVLFCGDQVLVVRILQLCISITYHQGRYIRSIATNGAEVSLMLARCARFQLSPVDRISALLTVSSSWCPGRVQSRSDHVLSARLIFSCCLKADSVSLCEFGHSGVLIVPYLCSVPNLVQISVTVNEIGAHML